MDKKDVEEGYAMVVKYVMYNTIFARFKPHEIKYVADYLEDTDIITTVIAFPYGTATTESKAFETEDAIARGADEIDMVTNIKSHDWSYVEKDILAVVEVGNHNGC
jgi:deoxyribose-phosphate aldolase